jgi:hypothetical protein
MTLWVVWILGLLIYAPGSQSSDDYGFASVGEIVVEADDALACCGFITPRHRDIRYYKALQKALDDANDNLNFLQSKPCPFDYNSPVILPAGSAVADGLGGLGRRAQACGWSD